MRTEKVVSRWAVRIAGALALVCVPTVALAGWTPWCSEETAPAECPPGQAAIGLQCNGDYCDNVSLNCASAAGGVTFVNPEWTEFFSEEESPGPPRIRNSHICFTEHGLGVVTGIRCRGDYCDDISLQCSTVVSVTPQGFSYVNVSGGSCTWTFPISEEIPSFVRMDRFMTGVLCSGDYCDDKGLLYCTW